MTAEPEEMLGDDETVPPVEAAAPEDEVRVDPAVPAEKRRRRGFTIRLKLTLWWSALFILAGILLIGINYYMVRNSLVVAPEKARAAVAERYGMDPSQLEPGHELRVNPVPGGVQFEFGQNTPTLGGVPIPRLISEAQQELRREALRQLWMRSVLALAIIVVLTFGLAWLLAGRMLRPVHAITSTARKLSGSTLHERIRMKGPRDELTELADTFDGMLERLDTAFTAQKEFVANASHELRTPLTIIRTEIDVALSDPNMTAQELQEMGAAVTEAVDRSEDLIDGLLVLASAEESPKLSDLDLAEVTIHEIDLASSEADSLGLRLDLDLQTAPVKGERSLLQRLAGNLVENAIRHNQPDGWFSVKTRVDNGNAVLEVANSGPVVRPEDAARLFERFYRADRSRSRKTGGFGLGLSIVKSVATALGGTVELQAPATGGLVVTVTLPATKPEEPDTGS